MNKGTSSEFKRRVEDTSRLHRLRCIHHFTIVTSVTPNRTALTVNAAETVGATCDILSIKKYGIDGIRQPFRKRTASRDHNAGSNAWTMKLFAVSPWVFADEQQHYFTITRRNFETHK
jgi:hypothetical protein